MMHGIFALSAITMLASSGLKVQSTAPDISPLLADVIRCPAIVDVGQRMACYDGSVPRLKVAVERRDVAIIDREQVRSTRRSLFGLSLPNLPAIFSGDGPGREEPEVLTLESEVVRVSAGGAGKWAIVLPDGAAWQFAETRRAVEPQAGDKILIKRTALGGYMANIDGRRAVRVQRIR